MSVIRKPDGTMNWGSFVMFIIAIFVLITIVYLVSSTIYNQYKETVKSEPWLVETTKSASSQKIIPGKTILRAEDGKYGIEFSYSMWIYLDNWEDNSRYFTENEKGRRISLSHILHKGDPLANPNQAPGFWLQRVNNDLRFVCKMNTFSTYDGCVGEACYIEKCNIGNLPLNKWFHITVVVINRNVDIYVNGFLKKRCLLDGLPRQNDGDIYINSFGGFKGFLSRVRYFNYAIQAWKIEQILKQGPSQYFGPDISQAVPPYFANDWWEQRFGIPRTLPQS